MKTLWACLLLIMNVVAFAAPSSTAPKKAVCQVCSMRGEGHAAERVAATSTYKDEEYYFCAKACKAVFDKDPEWWMPPVLPRPAPKFALKDVNGAETASSKSLKGKVVLVDFWATWCPPCVKAMPQLQKLHDRLAPKGFTVVGISTDEGSVKKVKPFLAKWKLTYPLVLDSANMWKAFGVKGLPSMYLIKDGLIVQQWAGEIEHKEVEKAVEAALKP
jgi:peroxiredoxin/YHS domain-containing protein